MSAFKLSDHVYAVGVMNPSLRVFDIVMESRYGTSYNAYLITGEKNVLIETVHEDYFDEYLDNIQEIIDISAVDYLIMNHTEPDHSGSIRRLLALNPRLTLLCTPAANKYLKEICNMEYQANLVKDGELLELPGCTLRFIVAPMLHWPDSMFTYIEEKGILFTCDFLGAHFCEPRVLDRHVKYKEAYEGEFEYYFQGIFGPFKTFVAAGLKKLEGLDISMICPSHGPVLVEYIQERLAQYDAWSSPAEKTVKKAVVLYASAYGYTAQLASAAYQGIIEGTGCSATLVDMVTTPVEETAALVAEADILLVGSNTINRDAPGIVWSILSRVDAVNTKGKAAGVFGSYGWSGEAGEMIRTRLSQLKYTVADTCYRVVFRPTEQNLAEMAEYAKSVAALSK